MCSEIFYSRGEKNSRRSTLRWYYCPVSSEYVLSNKEFSNKVLLGNAETEDVTEAIRLDQKIFHKIRGKNL